MEISPWALFRMFLWALLLGAVLGLVYDGFRIVRLLCGEPCERLREKRLPLIGQVWPSRRRLPAWLHGFILGLQDLTFFGLAGVSFAVLLYTCNRGQFRGFALLALPLGWLGYAVTVGRWIRRMSEWLAFAVRAVVRYAFFVAVLPFAAFFLGVRRVLRAILARLRPRWQARRARRQDRILRRELLQQAERGFLPSREAQAAQKAARSPHRADVKKTEKGRVRQNAAEMEKGDSDRRGRNAEDRRIGSVAGKQKRGAS